MGGRTFFVGAFMIVCLFDHVHDHVHDWMISHHTWWVWISDIHIHKHKIIIIMQEGTGNVMGL